MNTRSWSFWSVALAAAVTACTGVRSAPKGTPRVEVEVVHEVDPASLEPFQDGVDAGSFEPVLRGAAGPLADVGLRFYPVPTERYESGQQRPDYVMTFRLVRIDPERELVTKEQKSEDGTTTTKEIQARVKGVSATVSVAIEKRRPDGPMLTVGETSAAGRASPSGDAAAATTFALDRHSTESNVTAVDSAALERAVRSAIERALPGLQDAIDRELAMLKSTGAPQTRGS